MYHLPLGRSLCQRSFWISLSLLCSIHLHAATFTVINTNNAGSGSLRQAIISANTNPGPDRIEFQLPGNAPFLIAPLSILPPLTEPAEIDATTQPGYLNAPLVELCGSNMRTNADVLQILGGQSVVRGLSITHSKRDGIRVSGPRGTNVIEANYLGLTPQGVAAGNTGAGVTLYRSAGNMVGGTSEDQRNYISGGNWFGVYLVDAAARSNFVIGNYIGVGLTPTRASSNRVDGVVISGAPGNFIGIPGAGNVISGNGGSGIFVYNAANTGNATNNVISGNLIGTDGFGGGALPNAGSGITVFDVANNQIGGIEPGAGNVISGNRVSGIVFNGTGASNNIACGNLIGTGQSGSWAVPNSTNGITIMDAPNTRIGGRETAARNVISGNQERGIAISGAGASGTLVQGNYIGVDIFGVKRIPNTSDGVEVAAAATTLGGAEPGTGNVISGNYGNGVFLTTEARNCSLRGNYIGTDCTGTSGLGNGGTGLRIESSANLVGGSEAWARNIISANTNSGIFFYGIAASNNIVRGNYIGVNATGTAALGNGYAGISISNAPANVIGGPLSGEGNLLSGNNTDGLSLAGKIATGTTVQGNYLGTDATGTNALGNGLSGIYLYGASSNLIGGPISGAGNLICANGQNGIFATGSGANSNVVQGNFVGVAADGTRALGNLQYNIEFDTGTSGNLVGGSSPEAENRIAYASTGKAGYDGIRVRSGCVGNFISRNSIYLNGNSSINGLGIDTGVDGVTTNGLPVITSAVANGSQTLVQGTLKGVANITYLIQFYANTALPASGYGEGLAYVGSQSVTPDSKGNASFSATLSNPTGQFVTATATDPARTTSEFSKAVPVSGVQPQTVTPTPAAMVKSLRPADSTQPGLTQVLSSSASQSPQSPALHQSTYLTASSVWNSTQVPKFDGELPTVSATIASAEPVLHTLFTNGPVENRLNIVVLSEGYTAEQMDTFLIDAHTAVDKMLSFAPYNEYRNYINAYAIAVPSAQSGSSHLQWPVTRDTYFNSSYDAVEDRILSIPPNDVDSNPSHGMGKVNTLLQSLMPQCGLPVLLVNDLVAGGSGGDVCIASLGEPSAEFLAHESGHTLAKLGDEYEAARDYAGSLTGDVEPNTTKETRRGYIKWKAWIDSSTPIPTPPTDAYADVVGLFKGAHYASAGWYRPQTDCIMRTMEGVPFCKVCAEALIKGIYKEARPIDSFSPQSSTISLSSDESALFSVTPLEPSTHPLTVQWFINNIAVQNATNSVFDFVSSGVTNGTYKLSARVADLTPSVRNDPTSLLSTSVVWTVIASGMPTPPAITTQPQSQLVRSPGPATLSVTATGTQPLFFQWQHNGSNLLGQTSATLALDSVQAAQAGIYTVVVSNLYGKVTSRPVVLTITYPMSVAINGPGTVQSNYNALWLEVGRTYTMTAVASNRCVFTNWTGTLATNKARLAFVFQPGMTLTANFIDPQKPTLAIASPAERARSTNAVLTATGTTADNIGIQTVQYRLNGGSFTQAQTTNNWKKWTATLAPRAGSNLLEAFTIDSFGNQSPTLTRRFTYVVLQPLTVNIQGTGTITPNLNGKLLEIGQTYSMKAIPGTGQVFAGWDNGSRNPLHIFQMQSNLVVEARFQTNPFTPVVGTYNGLFLPSDGTNFDATGFVRVNLTGQGGFTGSLMDGGTYGFSGSFWVDGLAQVRVPRKDKAPVTLSLQLDLTNGTDQITGTASTTNWSASLTCDRATFSVAHQPPQAGRYTLALTQTNADPGAPLGDGYCTLTIDAAGTIRATAGTLADGTPFSQSVSLSKDGRWPFYASLYQGKGVVAGWLQLTNETPSIAGNAIWIKTPIAGKYYPEGFTTFLTATGSGFKTAKGTPVFPANQATLVLDGGCLTLPITNTLSISTNNLVSVTIGTNSVKLTINPANGLVSGSFIHPTTRALTALKGILLQEQQTMRGFFLGTNASGVLRVDHQ